MKKKKKQVHFQTITIIIVSLLVVLLLIDIFLRLTRSDPLMELHEEITEDERLAFCQDQKPKISVLDNEFIKKNDGRFFADAKEGDYLFEYVGSSVIYRPSTGDIVNIQEILPPDFFSRLYSNDRVKNLESNEPQTIRVTMQNIDVLSSQIIGITEDNLGDYILTYPGFIVIYDYSDNIVKSIISLTQKSNNLMDRLTAHQGFEMLRGETPEGAQIDGNTLEQLKQANPVMYQNAEVGDYVLRFEKYLVIYDFEDDLVRNIFPIQ